MAWDTRFRNRWGLGHAIREFSTRRWLYFTCHVILVLAGLLLVLLDPEQLNIGNLLAPIGASLIAMGIAGAVLFLKVWVDQKQSEQLRDLHEFGIRRIFAVRGVRIHGEYDTRLANASDRIDIMGFGLRALREDYGEKFGEWAERARVRILVLDPEFPSGGVSIAGLRDLEEGNSGGTIGKDVEQFVDHCRELVDDGNTDFTVRLYRCLPSVNIFRIDDEVFWGPYLIREVSRNMPTFLLEGHGRLSAELVGHFERIWNSDEFSRIAPTTWS